GPVAWAASGRNMGFVLPGFSEDIDGIIERVGLDHAKQLWALSEQGLDYVRRTILDTRMPGVDLIKDGCTFRRPTILRSCAMKLSACAGLEPMSSTGLST